MSSLTAKLFRVVVKDGMTTLSWRRREAASFDGQGRPIAFGFDGAIYRYGLDGAVQRLFHQRDDDGERYNDVELLSSKRAENLLQRLKQRVTEALEEGVPQQTALQNFLQHDTNTQAERFATLYGRISILPPDAYRSVVANLTRGCSYNRCNFCTLYKDRPYLLRTEAMFVEHLTQIRHFFGKGLSYRRGVFLGEGNAGSLPTEVLEAALQQIRVHLPEVGPTSTFLDTFSNPLRDVGQWRRLRDAGLARVYLGLESGSKNVLKILGKPGSPTRYRPLVETLKEAGLSVGAIVLSGVTSRELAEEHVDDTVAMLNGLPLQGDDRVFLSEYLHDATSQMIWEPRPRPEIRRETRAVLGRLTLPFAPRGPGRTPYELKGFLY